MKYEEYIKGEPISSSKRICNVCICLKCNEEFLLGLRCKCGEVGNHTLRKNPTLIK